MSFLGSLFRSTEKSAAKDVKAVKPAEFVAPKAPTAPKSVVPTSKPLSEPLEVAPLKPKSGEIAPAPTLAPKSGSGVGALGIAGVGAGAFLLPSFLGGGGGGGGGGVLGSLIGGAASVGSTALVADAATTLGGQAISAVSDTLGAITGDPVKLGIVAAVIVGVLVLSRK